MAVNYLSLRSSGATSVAVQNLAYSTLTGSTLTAQSAGTFSTLICSSMTTRSISNVSTAGISSLNVVGMGYSTLVGSTLYGNSGTVSTLTGSTVVTGSIGVSTLTGSTLYSNSGTVSTLLGSTLVTGSVGVSTLTGSTLFANGLTTSVLSVTSTMISIGPNTQSTITSASQGSYAAGSWQTTKSGLTNTRQVAMSSTGQYQIVISNVTADLWISSDSAITWSSLNSAQGLPVLTGSAYWSAGAISASGQHIMLSVYGGSIWYSSDYGRTFATSLQATPDIWLQLNGSLTDTMGVSTVTAPETVPGYVNVAQPGFTDQAVNLLNTAGGTATRYIQGNWSGSANFTVSFWFNSQNVTPAGTIFRTSSGQIQIYQISGALYYAMATGGSFANVTSNTITISTNTWYYVSITFQTNGTCSIYVNNSLIGSSSNVGGLDPFTGYFIGCDHVSQSTAFNGYIADLRIYNSAITYVPIPLLAPNIWLAFEGSTADVGSNAITPSVTGSLSYVPGAVGLTAAYLANEANVSAGTAAANYISIPYTQTTPMTFSFWFRLTSIASSGTTFIATFTDASQTISSIELSILNSSSTLFLGFNQVGSIPTGYVVRPNVWYHATSIYQPSVSLALYVDGQFISAITSGIPSGLSAGPPGNANGRIVIGDRRAYGSIGPFAGYIDDFRIYNSAIPFYNHVPRNYTHLTMSGNGAYRMSATQLGNLLLSSDSGLTWAQQSATQTPGAWSSLSASHTGKYLTAQSQPVVQPNQLNLAANTWSQQGVTYTASASSNLSTLQPYGAFNNYIGGAGNYSWASARTYNATTGLYSGAVSTTIQGGIGAILGEWIQLQTSVPLVLQSHTFAVGDSKLAPKTYHIVGSNDGSTWFPVQYMSMTTNPVTTSTFIKYRNNIIVNYSGPQTIYGDLAGLGTTTSYSTSTSTYIYFRIIIQAIWPSAPDTPVEILEWYPNFIGGSITPNQSGLATSKWLNSGVSWAASSSTILNNYYAYTAFNNVPAEQGWISATTYNTTYIGSVSTTIQGGIGAILGEWFQLQVSVPLVLQSYAYACQALSNIPKIYYIVGSNDGSTWYPLQYVSMTTSPFTGNYTSVTSTNIIMNYSGTQTIQGQQTGQGNTTAYSPYVTQAFQYFRIVIQSLYTTGANAALAEFVPYFTAGQNSSSNYGLTWTPTQQTGDAFNVTKNLTVLSTGTGFATLSSFSPVEQGVTFSVWFTLQSAPSQFARIFDFGLGSLNSTYSLHLYFNTNRTVSYIVYVNSAVVGSITSTTVIALNTQYHIAITTDGTGNIIMYMNGSQEVVLGSALPLAIVTYTYNYIGRGNFNGDPYPNMTVRDFRMFNRGLNAAEVSALYANVNYGQPAVGPLSLSGSGSHALTAIGSTALLDGGNYLTAYQASNFVAPLLTGINAPIVATSVSYDAVYMILVTSGTTNNVYYSTNYGATFTGLTIGSSAMVSCAISYDGSYFTVSNATTTYRLNSNSTGFSIAVGSQAGQTNQAVNAIAIGNKAGQANQSDNSIVLNATGSTVGTGVSGFYVAPIAGAESSTSSSLSLLGYGTDNQIVQSGVTILALEKGVNGGVSTQLSISKGSIQATNYTHQHWNSAKVLVSFLVASGTYWKIASLGPAGSSDCWGTLNIKGSFGGFLSDQIVNVDVSLSTRAGVVVNGQARCANLANALQHMNLGYVSNLGGGYDVYLYTTALEYISFDLDISGHQTSASNVFLYDPSLTTPITQSPGTLTSLVTACQIINQGTNVGIGTTNPGSVGTIYGYTYPITAANAPSYSTYGQLCLTDSTGPSTYPTARGSLKLGYDASVGGWGAGFIQPVVPNLQSTPLLLCPYSGYVGIGMTAPSQRLDVAGSVNCTGLLVNGVAVATGTGSVWSVSGSNISYTSGNVGIGTNDTNARLVVMNDSGSGISDMGIIKVMRGPNAVAEDKFWIGFSHGTAGADSNDRARIGTYIENGGKGHLFFTTGASGSQAERLRITGDGNVGIGTTNPTYQLHLYNISPGILFTSTSYLNNPWYLFVGTSNGSIYLGPNTGSGTPGCNVPIGGNAWQATSDVRLKRKIAPIQNSLDRILQLKPVMYQFKSDADHEVLREGFIAQDVQSVFPSKWIVNENGMPTVQYDENGQEYNALSLCQTQFIPHMVRAIQELKGENNQLTSALADKSAQLDALLTWAKSKGFSE